MLARVYVVFPFTLDLVIGEKLAVREWEEGGYRIAIFPPVKIDGLTDQRLSGFTLKSSDRDTAAVRALHIQFRKNDFARAKNAPLNVEPPSDLILKVANSFLARLRVVTNASFIQPIDENVARWSIEYLQDDGTLLPVDDDKLPVSSHIPIIVNSAIVDAYSWEKVQELPLNFGVPPWQAMLLDARAMWRDPGPALILAATAHETVIQWALAKLAAKSPIPVDLWDWINDRGDFRKDASVSEKFDVLLKAVGGKSLKEDNELWEAFTQIRDARNNFVHEGQLAIGRGSKKQMLTVSKAQELVARAIRVVEFVRDRLPEEDRWPVYNWDPKISLHLPNVGESSKQEPIASADRMGSNKDDERDFRKSRFYTNLRYRFQRLLHFLLHRNH